MSLQYKMSLYSIKSNVCLFRECCKMKTLKTLKNFGHNFFFFFGFKWKNFNNCSSLNYNMTIFFYYFVVLEKLWMLFYMPINEISIITSRLRRTCFDGDTTLQSKIKINTQFNFKRNIEDRDRLSLDIAKRIKRKTKSLERFA